MASNAASSMVSGIDSAEFIIPLRAQPISRLGRDDADFPVFHVTSLQTPSRRDHILVFCSALCTASFGMLKRKSVSYPQHPREKKAAERRNIGGSFPGI